MDRHPSGLRRSLAAGLLALGGFALAGCGTAEPSDADDIAALTTQQNRAPYDVAVFARVPAVPGLPEGIAVSDRGEVYVSTNPGGNAPGLQNGRPSEILVYGRTGRFLRRYVVEGQRMGGAEMPAYGLQALAFDGEGSLYAVDKVPPRVIRLDPETGRQTDYAHFPNVPPCAPSRKPRPCSRAAVDRPAAPDYLAFGDDGSLYVSDFQQALIWRVPPGGGAPEVALSDAEFDAMTGAHGLQVIDEGRTLMISASSDSPDGFATGPGRLYKADIDADGALHGLRVFYESRPHDGPDGFAVARSGNVYLNAFLSSQIVVIGPDGRERRRIVTQDGQEIPFDSPSSSVFVGDHLLVTNHAVITRNALDYAVFDILAGERGVPLIRP